MARYKSDLYEEFSEEFSIKDHHGVIIFH